MKERELIELARKVLKNSYSPYSKVEVAAVLLTKDGKVFTGANIENASYGLSICAERAAVFQAVTNGYRDFSKIVICSNLIKPILPCGACCQVLFEFSPQIKIITMNKNGIKETFNLKEVFPRGFRLTK